MTLSKQSFEQLAPGLQELNKNLPLDDPEGWLPPELGALPLTQHLLLAAPPHSPDW